MLSVKSMLIFEVDYLQHS